MQISDTASSHASSHASSQAQRLLASLLSQQTKETGQDASGVESGGRPQGRPPAPPPGPPPSLLSGSDGMASSRFSSDTLSELLSTQREPPSAEDVAAKLIRDLDSDGDESLSLSEVQTALGASDETSSISEALAKLDTDGDGKLGNAELASALEAFKAAHGAPPHRTLSVAA